MNPCPRRVEGPWNDFKLINKPDDNNCDYCGSLDPDIFMQRLEQQDVRLTPTDKSYKVYVVNKGGEQFKQTYRIDKPSKPGEIMKDPMDQSHWIWETRAVTQTKFYFQHLSKDQMIRFVELYNEKKLDLDMPGYFYNMPFFMTNKPTDK